VVCSGPEFLSNDSPVRMRGFLVRLKHSKDFESSYLSYLYDYVNYIRPAREAMVGTRRLDYYQSDKSTRTEALGHDGTSL
jgi:hypothetical protein